MKILFWFSAAMIFYTYAGYPLLLGFVAEFFERKVRKGPYEPRVSIILSAFNEEKYIEKKLLNLLNLDYPEDKYEILVGSDGAGDATDAIISKFRSPRIRFFRFVTNLGKPHVVNALVEEASEAILVFTDARQALSRNAIRALAQNFYDPAVGCVSGELHFRNVPQTGVAGGMDLYWRYEKFLRRRESEIGSMLGATGALYAVRRSLFTPIPVDILVDDMYLPLAVIRQGYRVVFESEASAYDQVSQKGREEFKRKVRTLTGNYQIFWRLPHLFDPFGSSVAWQLFSHKFLRLMVPFFLAGLLIADLALLKSPGFQLFFLLQILFYSLALWEAFKDFYTDRSKKSWGRASRKGMSQVAYTFCLLNYSAFVALIQSLKKKTLATWEKAYV